MASKDVEHSKVEEEEEQVEGTTAGGEEEDTGAQIAPIIKLEEVAVTTGEEEEDVLLDLKAKLYRFDKDGNQWKERGVGTVKLLKHKQTSKVRLVMRQSKTLKICANHLVLPTISMQEHAGNEKSCVWHAADFSDGELKEELFCIRFASIENAKAFKEMVEEVAESQVKKSAESKEGAASLADDLTEKLSVGEKKEDVPTPEKEKKDEPEAEASSAEKEKKDE
ncbi:hypothetical protein MKW92_020649 [Papaver armeniacum]|nr:hypothetical protein MKW92_020649 [Papaver armeniacum]